MAMQYTREGRTHVGAVHTHTWGQYTHNDCTHVMAVHIRGSTYVGQYRYGGSADVRAVHTWGLYTRARGGMTHMGAV